MLGHIIHLAAMSTITSDPPQHLRTSAFRRFPEFYCVCGQRVKTFHLQKKCTPPLILHLNCIYIFYG